jgi:hypothetical protein
MHCASCSGRFFRCLKYIMRYTVLLFFITVVVLGIWSSSSLSSSSSSSSSPSSSSSGSLVTTLHDACLRWFSQRYNYRSFVKKFTRSNRSAIFMYKQDFIHNMVYVYNQPVSLMYILLNKLRIPTIWNDSLFIFKSELRD